MVLVVLCGGILRLQLKVWVGGQGLRLGVLGGEGPVENCPAAQELKFPPTHCQHCPSARPWVAALPGNVRTCWLWPPLPYESAPSGDSPPAEAAASDPASSDVRPSLDPLSWPCYPRPRPDCYLGHAGPLCCHVNPWAQFMPEALVGATLLMGKLRPE